MGDSKRGWIPRMKLKISGLIYMHLIILWKMHTPNQPYQLFFLSLSLVNYLYQLLHNVGICQMYLPT